MTEEQVERAAIISRIQDDLWSLKFELKAQKNLIAQIEQKLQEIADAISRRS